MCGCPRFGRLESAFRLVYACGPSETFRTNTDSGMSASYPRLFHFSSEYTRHAARGPRETFRTNADSGMSAAYPRSFHFSSEYTRHTARGPLKKVHTVSEGGMFENFPTFFFRCAQFEWLAETAPANRLVRLLMDHMDVAFAYCISAVPSAPSQLFELD